MKRPVTPKQLHGSRPKRTTRQSVKVLRPSSNQAKTIRPNATAK